MIAVRSGKRRTTASKRSVIERSASASGQGAVNRSTGPFQSSGRETDREEDIAGTSGLFDVRNSWFMTGIPAHNLRNQDAPGVGWRTAQRSGKRTSVTGALCLRYRGRRADDAPVTVATC